VIAITIQVLGHPKTLFIEVLMQSLGRCKQKWVEALLLFAVEYVLALYEGSNLNPNLTNFIPH
jgi:hypothetical protein